MVALGAIALVWSVVAYGLLTAVPPAAQSGLDTGAAMPAISWLPLLTAGLFSCLVLFGLQTLRRSLRLAGEQIELHRKIIHHASEAVLVIDADQRILAVNPAFEQVSGYTTAEIIGQSSELLCSERNGPDFYQKLWSGLRDTGQWEGEIWGRSKSGELFPRLLRLNAVCEGDVPTHYVAVFSDISAQKAQEARIEYLAHHDPLTGLPNRVALGNYFERALSAARDNGSQLAVLIIDLDNFKMVNDSLGHHAGDRLLCEVARRLLQVAGEFDQVIRLGGDEFVLLLENVPNTDVVLTNVQALMKAVSETCEIDGHPLHTSLSIGISLFPGDGDTPEALMRNADTAMYYAKANGRNKYQFFAAPMNAAANKRLHLESELWEALANNELLLHYQPQLDLPSGRIVGVEALVRWQHPKLGMIPPADFIPVAEDSGLILPLGHWVLLTACRQAKAWLDAGIDMGEIAVNISAYQFRQPEFAQSVRAVLAESGLPAERLELEITESTIMHSADSSVTTLEELKAMGVKLAVDDFGTGYSSLSYLRRFPIDRLKIDRSFVADMESDADAASLVASIIALGGSLGLRLVAEGVENSAQVSSLREMACERVQGFHFCRPMPAEGVVDMLNSLRPGIAPD
ncbi:putative bifunctional diguanylate cyclase/phosphodiesterase [Dechloromonas denitrificans]|nr:EAL domain-containing protein [Dechloromonas denitrificans]